MANTIAGTNLTQISIMSLDILQRELIPFQAFQTDFSAELAQEGAAITTRIATAPSAADLSSGYTAVDQTLTAKTVTLSNFKGLVVGFTDLEVTKSSVSLIDLFIVPGVRAMTNAIFDDVNNLVTNANFSQNEVVAAASFTANSLALLSKDLTLANASKDGRAAIINSTYFYNLAKDADLKNYLNYGSNSVIVNNVIPRVHGFDVYELSSIDSTPNAQSENLAGWVNTKQALLIAARLPAAPANFPGEIANVTDPGTGFSYQFRRWYDPDAGLHKMSVGTIWGVSVGNASCLYRILSA